MLLRPIRQFVSHLPRVPFRVQAPILVATVLLWPIALGVLLASVLRRARWHRRSHCRWWLRAHQDAFPDLDPETLEIEPRGGGVCNAGYVWRCRTRDGREAEYFVKLFLPLGTLWAKLCPWLSPFPRVPAAGSKERLETECASCVALSHRHVPVPALRYCDPANRLTINECLHGVMVHHALDAIAERGFFRPEERFILAMCGRGLAQVHAAGLSLVDAQPANCMWVPQRQRVYFLDLEFCTREDRRQWDVEFFLAYVRAQLSGALQAEGTRLVLEGYHEIRPAPPRARARMRSLLRPFVPVFRAILEVRDSADPAVTETPAEEATPTPSRA